MIFKSYFVLLSYFLVQNLATKVDGMNLHDVSSIEIFINNVRERAWSYYGVENATINSDEKKDILKLIFYDLTKILTEFNEKSVDSRKVFSSGSLVSFVSTLKKLDPKNGSSLNPKLSDKLMKIFNISEAINSYVEPLLQLGADNISDDQDVLQFCPTDANARQNVQFKYEKQIILKEYKELVEILTAEIKYKTKFNTCGLTTSLNQAVFDYFHHVIVTYLKEYVMLYFIDIIDARCLDWNVMPLIITRQNESLSELSENIKLTKEFLATSQYSIHTCDADYRNITNAKSYYELERMIQTMIIAENELNNERSCKHNCNLKTMQSHANHPECKQFVDCQYIHSGYDICFSANNSSSKRYEWFKSNDGHIYGDYRGFCYHKEKSVNSYYRVSSANSCDYCICACLAKPQSKPNVITAISFRKQVTDIHKNMVVFGVRFVMKDYMIHVQVKEGQFSGNTSNNAHWKKLENFDYDNYKEMYALKYDDKVNIMLKEGVDYGHPEMINFDDVVAPEGCVVTGVRFRFAADSFENPRFKRGSIQLQIRVTPYDFTKGLVNIEETRWMAPNEAPIRFRMNLGSPKIPTQSPGNTVDSMPDQLVKFQHSDIVEDAGQSTVPFFDAQDVEGKPEFPLGGVGLVHRGRKGYGGFLAFRIFDVNLSKLFKDKSE